MYRLSLHFIIMKRFGVVGNPVLHSKSPFIFDAAYDSRYSYLRILAQSAKEAFDLFSALDLNGMNVTAPFKDVTLWGEGVKSPEVALLGLTNTIVRKENKIFFYNTDIDGVTNIIGDIGGKKCAVIGAGGAGCAAAYALTKKGGLVTIVNRTETKAEKIAKLIGCDYDSLENLETILTQTFIIVNTLNVKVMDDQWLTSGHTIIDAIYKNSPINSSVVNYINGEQWLINQGVASYRLFTEEEPNLDAMRQRIKQNNKTTTISLIGKIDDGVTIAKTLSERLGMEVKWQKENISKQLKKENVVIWLYSQSNENEYTKEYFASRASMVFDASFYKLEQIIDIIYGEISKTICN